MTILSKLMRKTCRQWTCYELGHTWTPSCSHAWTEVGLSAFKEGFKLYLPLYVIAAVIRGKGANYYLKKLIPEALRSASFLGANGFLFLWAFCVWRRLFGFYFLHQIIACGVPLSAMAVSIEQSGRRGLLAVYMANIAVETMYLMLKARGIVRPLPYGEIWLFSAATATVVYLFRRDCLQGSTHSAIRFLAVGSNKRNADNAPEPATTPAITASEAETRSLGAFTPAFLWFTKLKKRLLFYIDVLRLKASRHKLCGHANSCMYHTLEGGLRLFSYGYTLQIVLRVFRLLRLLPRHPLAFFKSLLLHRGSINFGAFLGCLVFLLRSIRCGLRHLLQRDAPWQSAVAGFFAGWSMMFFRSSSIAMYMTSKTVELLYMLGMNAGYLPSIKNGDILLYSLGVGFVFHACIFEPHNVRPAYYTFLKRVCGNRFQEMNRRLLDEFGTQASKLDPDFWPKYDARYTRLAEGPHMIEELTRAARVNVR